MIAPNLEHRHNTVADEPDEHFISFYRIGQYHAAGWLYDQIIANGGLTRDEAKARRAAMLRRNWRRVARGVG